MIRAFCYASGLIQFGRKVPDGALPIASGPAKDLREFIEGMSRHGYKTQRIKGRPTKIPGTDCLLVPGVPEAPNQSVGIDALLAWCDWIRTGAPKNILVHRRPGDTVRHERQRRSRLRRLQERQMGAQA